MAVLEGAALGFLVGLLVGGAIVGMVYQNKAAKEKEKKETPPPNQ
jgi:hypothetical protein